MVRVLFISILTLSIFTPKNSFSKISGFLATRQNFGGLGAARLGVNDIEFGIFAPGAIGINKKFSISNEYYAAFGFGITSPSAPIVMTGFGFNYWRFLGLGLRGELFTYTSTSGVLDGAGLLGASWNY
jgi:hypothetical protein